jgi:Na+-transporting NADH:ubiquinone oxidoreductase subunit NqrB
MTSATLPAPVPKKASRFNQLKPYLAPLLITVILVVGDVYFAVLQSYWHTGLAIACAIGLEIALSYFATGKFPHLASAYITGISVGILVQTPAWWPFAVCSLLSISSKYALRVKGRHLWNPSNLGVSVLLFLVPDVMAPLSDQWGNNVWPPRIIMLFGGVILFTLGRLHISFTYAAAYTLLTYLRCLRTGSDYHVELALLTAPAYLLFMCFMITDPKTTPRTWPRQIAVTLAVAIVETLLRLRGETHAPYYALFIVFPVANLLEIWWDSRKAQRPGPPKLSESPPVAEQAPAR